MQSVKISDGMASFANTDIKLSKNIKKHKTVLLEAHRQWVEGICFNYIEYRGQRYPKINWVKEGF